MTSWYRVRVKIGHPAQQPPSRSPLRQPVTKTSSRRSFKDAFPFGSNYECPLVGSRGKQMEQCGKGHQWDPWGEVAGREQPNMTTMFFLWCMSFKYIWLLFFIQSLIIMMEQRVFFQSVLGIIIYYSAFPEVENRKIFLVLVHQQVTWSTSTCSKWWEVWGLSLSVPFIFVALPLGEKSNEMD